MLDKTDLQRLRWPLPVSEHKFFNGRVYVTEFSVTNRIEIIDPAWQWQIISIQSRNITGTKESVQVTVHGRLTIGEVCRDGIGQATALQGNRTDKSTGEIYTEEVNEPEKSAETDALKRAARKFGIARYLLVCPKNIVNHDQLSVWLDTIKAQQRSSVESEIEERANGSGV